MQTKRMKMRLRPPKWPRMVDGELTRLPYPRHEVASRRLKRVRDFNV
jgi:hypothetical protein